jgi:hypothetical protein
MDEMKRPVGLTVLAVINFIFTAFSLLGAFGIIVAKNFINNMPMDQLSEQQAAQMAVMQNMSGTTLTVIVSMNIIYFLLLLLSGIGYLKLKKIMGRFVGNVYGAAAVIYSILSTMVFPDVFGKSPGIGAIISLIYPVLTLILLNTVFKKNLVH